MPTPRRIRPWLNLTIAQGNAVQIGGLLARTITVVDGVSKDRKVRLLEFLSETRLIRFGPQGEPPVISLRFADLREVPW